MDKTDEPVPTTPVIGPDWLPPAYLNQYLGYLQQYTHNVNLLRWFLADTKRPRPRDGGEEHDPAGSLRTQNVRAPETGAKSMIPRGTMCACARWTWMTTATPGSWSWM